MIMRRMVIDINDEQLVTPGNPSGESARELRELLEALYKDCGLKGLTDRSRRPYRHANRLPFQIEKLIVQLKRQRPSWGAPKIREKLRRLHSEVQTPAISTVHAVTLPSKYPKREHRE